MKMKLSVIYVTIVSLCASGSPNIQKLTSKESIPDQSLREDKHYPKGSHNFEFDHEAILGSRNTADEFDQLSPEESKKRLKVLAEKMDKNQDGYVDRDELTQWVLRSFKLLTEEEALDQLEDEDGDGDGKVTWEEHMLETYGMYGDEKTVEELSEDEKMVENDKELFEAADINVDGVLDKAEFPSFSHPEEYEHMHLIVYNQAMKKRDSNNDGYLSFEEFVVGSNGIKPHRTSEHYALEKNRFNNDFDRNKDGKLSPEEVLLWLVPSNYEMAETEADHLIGTSDDDKDGKLSILEILNHHDVFVGSEATDFGEHLQSTHKFVDEL